MESFLAWLNMPLGEQQTDVRGYLADPDDGTRMLAALVETGRGVVPSEAKPHEARFFAEDLEMIQVGLGGGVPEKCDARRSIQVGFQWYMPARQWAGFRRESDSPIWSVDSFAAFLFRVQLPNDSDRSASNRNGLNSRARAEERLSSFSKLSLPASVLARANSDRSHAHGLIGMRVNATDPVGRITNSTGAAGGLLFLQTTLGDRNGNGVVALMLLFNQLAFDFRWPASVTVALRLLAWVWLAFGCFYIFYWSHILYH